MIAMNEKNRIFAAAFDAKTPHAEVAESVDASVSKTDEVTLVPVRSRPSVRKIPSNLLIWRDFSFARAY